jgi:hypothetical protein
VLIVAIRADRHVTDAFDIGFAVDPFEVVSLDAGVAGAARLDDRRPGDLGAGIVDGPDIVPAVAADARRGEAQTGLGQRPEVDALKVLPDEFGTAFGLDPFEMAGCARVRDVEGERPRRGVIMGQDLVGAGSPAEDGEGIEPAGGRPWRLAIMRRRWAGRAGDYRASACGSLETPPGRRGSRRRRSRPRRPTRRIRAVDGEGSPDCP